MSVMKVADIFYLKIFILVPNENKFKLKIFVLSLNDSIWIQYDYRNCICIRKGFIDFGHVRKLCGIKMLKRKICGMSQKEQTAQFLLDHDLSGINFDKKRGIDQSEKCTIHNIQTHVFDIIDSYVIAKGLD